MGYNTSNAQGRSFSVMKLILHTIEVADIKIWKSHLNIREGSD